MDPDSEVAGHLGSLEGRHLRLVRSPNELANPGLPYLHLRGSALEAQGFNYEAHDNAPRMPYFCSLLSQLVLPRCSGRLEGYVSIELHDSHSYLAKAADMDYTGCLVWSKSKHCRRSVLIPDLYQWDDYGGRLRVPDQIPWHQKLDKVAFYGTTTGPTDPTRNTRIQLCRWRAENQGRVGSACDFFITNVAQMSEQAVVECVGGSTWQQMRRAWTPFTRLHDYKFNLDVPGNTVSWDRVPLVLASRSLLFKAPCEDMTFYYPLLHSGTHYVHVHNSRDILSKRLYYMANPREAQEITARANAFAGALLNQKSAVQYMVGLLEAADHYHGP